MLYQKLHGDSSSASAIAEHLKNIGDMTQEEYLGITNNDEKQQLELMFATLAQKPTNTWEHIVTFLNEQNSECNWRLISYTGITNCTTTNKKAHQLVGQCETRRHSSHSDCRL